jgi:NAD(P)-dependent dehydrogenase (short-subunit alcohol dehydrogenase family)
LDAAAAALGPGVVTLQADVTDVAAMERAFAKAAETLGKIDIVFANAGVGGASPLGQTSLAEFEKIVRTNLTAVFFTVQAALPHLSNGASIILNGSVHAPRTMPRTSPAPRSSSMAAPPARRTAPRSIAPPDRGFARGPRRKSIGLFRRRLLRH